MILSEQRGGVNKWICNLYIVKHLIGILIFNFPWKNNFEWGWYVKRMEDVMYYDVAVRGPTQSKLHTIDPTRSHKYSDSIQTIRTLTQPTDSRDIFPGQIIFQNISKWPISNSNIIKYQHKSHRILLEHSSYERLNIFGSVLYRKVYPINVEMGNKRFDCDCLLWNN